MASSKEDADLDDLLHTEDEPSGRKSHKLEMETLVQRPPGDEFELVPPFIGNRIAALCALMCYTMSSKPRLSFCVLTSLLAFFIFATVVSVKHEINPWRVATIKTDYSSVSSQYDLSLGKIDHWCIFGGDDGCSCNDPLDPISHAEVPGWIKTHQMNRALISRTVQSEKVIDVAFLGDSITEEWNGRWVGKSNPSLEPIKKTFEKYFTREGGGDYEGVALGIAGDQAPHVLWRLKHGNMPTDFNPRVWWLLVGMNDLTGGGCSPEVVLLGILRVVEEIQFRKPDAIIVVNGILPTAVPAIKREKRFKTAKVENPKNKKTTKGKTKKGGAGTVDKDGMEDPEESQKPKNKFMRGFTEVKDLGPTIKIINKQLKKFSEKHSNIHYFEGEDIFVTTNENGKRVIDMKLMSGVHPTPEGHKEWAKRIVKTLDGLITKQSPVTVIEQPPEASTADDDDDDGN